MHPRSSIELPSCDRSADVLSSTASIRQVRKGSVSDNRQKLKIMGPGTPVSHVSYVRSCWSLYGAGEVCRRRGHAEESDGRNKGREVASTGYHGFQPLDVPNIWVGEG